MVTDWLGIRLLSLIFKTSWTKPVHFSFPFLSFSTKTKIIFCFSLSQQKQNNLVSFSLSLDKYNIFLISVFLNKNKSFSPFSLFLNEKKLFFPISFSQQQQQTFDFSLSQQQQQKPNKTFHSQTAPLTLRPTTPVWLPIVSWLSSRSTKAKVRSEGAAGSVALSITAWDSTTRLPSLVEEDKKLSKQRTRLEHKL